MTGWMISTILLWLVVLALLLLVLALSRQIGVLYERVAPIGALTMDKGAAVREAAPEQTVTDIAGGQHLIGGVQARSQLLFFLSPTCPVCKKLLPALKSVAQAEKQWLQVMLASDGEMPEHLAFIQRAKLQAFPYVLSSTLGMSFHISKLPYAVLIDENGIVRAKGLINSREHLESLFTAKELGVASVQDYLAGREGQANTPTLQETPHVMAG